MTPDPNEDFCRKLCEKHGQTILSWTLDELGNVNGRTVSADPVIIAVLVEAIQIVMEKAAKVCEAKGRNVHVG